MASSQETKMDRLTLEGLPDDLIWMIACELRSQIHLKQLCETSKRLYTIVHPRLFESVTLVAEARCLADIASKIKRLPLGCLNYTKAVTLKTPLRYGQQKRCPHIHPDLLRLDMGSKEEGLNSLFSEMMNQLDILFSALEINKLRSFGWELGICIPDDRIWSCSEMFKRQNCIEHLSLITDPACGVNLPASFSVALGELKRLRSLSWRGISTYENFRCLSEGLRSSGNTIESLTLDLKSWTQAAKLWFSVALQKDFEGLTQSPRNFFASSTLGIAPGQEIDLFPALNKLSLTAVSFDSFAREMSYAMHMNRLSSLKLLECPYSLDLLASIIALGDVLNLRSFEFKVRGQDLMETALNHDETVLSQFLMAFQGLEDLCLSFPKPTDWAFITEGLLNHKSSLKWLVLQGGREVVRADTLESTLNKHACCLFQDTEFTCLGFSGSQFGPESIWASILHFKPKCRVLHIRVNGTHLEFAMERQARRAARLAQAIETTPRQQVAFATGSPGHPEPPSLQEQAVRFAQEAFGPGGLPGLQVIAFGDFSHTRLEDKHNMLLCKDESEGPLNPSRVRAVTPADHHLESLVLDNMEILSACPYASLL